MRHCPLRHYTLTLGLTNGAFVAPLLCVNLSDVYLEHIGPAGGVVTVGAGVSPGLEMDCLHVLLETLSQGKPLPTLTHMRQLFLVDNLDMTPQRRGLIKLSPTFLTHEDNCFQMYRLVVF